MKLLHYLTVLLHWWIQNLNFHNLHKTILYNLTSQIFSTESVRKKGVVEWFAFHFLNFCSLVSNMIGPFVKKQLSYRLCFNCVICRNSNFQCSLSSTYICLIYLLLFEREHWENFPPFFRSFEIFEILCACFVIADHQNFRERWRGWRTSISNRIDFSKKNGFYLDVNLVDGEAT